MYFCTRLHRVGLCHIGVLDEECLGSTNGRGGCPDCRLKI
jgi:hypothetical protein